jgi:hypothetical protein
VSLEAGQRIQNKQVAEFDISLLLASKFICARYDTEIDSVTHTENASQCSACPGGQYCSDSGLTAPTGACSAGYWCSVGSAHANASACDSRELACSSGCGGICPKGTYCPRGSGQPTPCPQVRLSQLLFPSCVAHCAYLVMLNTIYDHNIISHNMVGFAWTLCALHAWCWAEIFCSGSDVILMFVCCRVSTANWMACGTSQAHVMRGTSAL